ncbi:hypothetical protein M8J77_019546 [Diaphorina citri]|nr:hypothetical protein M8J77_019546 [Diaphorina citri]
MILYRLFRLHCIRVNLHSLPFITGLYEVGGLATGLVAVFQFLLLIIDSSLNIDDRTCFMGVYEGLGPGMHWQQAQTHPPSVQSCGRIISTPLYDPSRNSSPNLPCGQQEPMNPSQTQLLNNNPSCCNFKREYNRGDNCHDCSQNNMYAARCNSTPSGEERKYSDLLEPKQEPTNLDSDEAANVTCAGCSRKIVDRFYLYAVDQRWHVSCLQCSQCGRTLDGEMTCFCKDGTIYCKNDYYR